MTADGRTHAIVVGSFLPPHAGHLALIEHAAQLADHIDVVVCDEPGQRPSAERRATWIRTLRPDVAVSVVPDICGWHTPAACPLECSRAWADHLSALGQGPWNTVVSSEDYGRPFAEALGATHAVFDQDRERVPCSGTEIRNDLRAGWRWLDPVVRAGLTRKVVIVGAESTGTTTLANDLATELGAPWVPEFGRAESVRLAERFGSVWDIEWTAADFERIADEQARDEGRHLDAFVQGPATFGTRGPWLVCDTDVLATSLWRERYLGEGSPAFVRRALEGPHRPDLYVLTSPDGVDFEQDGSRDGEHLRTWMTDRFRTELPATGVPWVEVRGSTSARLAGVLDALDSLPPALRQPPSTGRAPSDGDPPGPIVSPRRADGWRGRLWGRPHAGSLGRRGTRR